MDLLLIIIKNGSDLLEICCSNMSERYSCGILLNNYVLHDPRQNLQQAFSGLPFADCLKRAVACL
jgi:hypothetical protein